jgi:ligand-binding sensor domain-containing protein
MTEALEVKVENKTQGIIMKFRIFSAVFLVIYLLPVASHSLEKNGWTQYSGVQSISSIALQGEVCWIGNGGGGLYKLNARTDEMAHFTNLNSGLPSNIVSGVTTGPDNTAWIATANGLASFDENSWHVFNRDNAPFATNDIKALSFDEEGNLWVSSVSGFYCYKDAQWTDILKRYPGFPLEMLTGATKIFCIGSEIWLQLLNCYVCFNKGTWERLSEISGLCIGSDGTRWYFSTRDKTLIGIGKNTIESIPVPMSYLSGTLFIDSSDTKWIYRNDTLYCKKSDQWLIISIPQTFRNGSNSTFLRMDDAQNIWFSGKSSLLRYSPSLDEWKSFSIVYSSDFRYSSISKIALDADNHLWLQNSRLYYSDSNALILSEPFPKALTPRNIVMNKLGRLNVASWNNINNGLALYAAVKEGKNADGFWSVTQCTCETDVCYMVCYDPATNAWIYNTNSYTRGFGLKVMREGQCQSLPYPGNDTTNSLAGLDVTDKGTLWALTKGNSLFRYKNNMWEDRTAERSVPTDSIRGILGAGGDTLWIGTINAGLARFDGVHWQFFDTKPAKKTFVILPLHYDQKRGELWCSVYSTNQTYGPYSLRLEKTKIGEGLYRFNGTTGTLFTPANSGIFDLDIKSVASDTNGLWVASTYGLAYWSREQLAKSILKPGDIRLVSQKQSYRVQTFGNKKVELDLDSPGFVSVSIYSLTGRLVRTIDAGKRSAGHNLITLSDFDQSHRTRNLYIVSVNVRKHKVTK